MRLFGTNDYKTVDSRNVHHEFVCGIDVAKTEAQKKSGDQIILVGLPKKTYIISVAKEFGNKLIKNVAILKKSNFSLDIISISLQAELMDALRQADPTQPELVALKEANSHFKKMLHTSYYISLQDKAAAAAQAKMAVAPKKASLAASVVILQPRSLAVPAARPISSSAAAARALVAVASILPAASSSPAASSAVASKPRDLAETIAPAASSAAAALKEKVTQVSRKRPLFQKEEANKQDDKKQRTQSPVIPSRHSSLYNQTPTPVSLSLPISLSLQTPPRNAPPSLSDSFGHESEVIRPEVSSQRIASLK